MKLREFLVFGPVWGSVTGSVRRLKPRYTLSAGVSVGDRGVRKKCGLTDLILSRYLSRFSLRCDRAENTETVVGQACESVRLQKRTDCCSHVHRVLTWCDGGAPFLFFFEDELMTCASAFFFSSWLDLPPGSHPTFADGFCGDQFLQSRTLTTDGGLLSCWRQTTRKRGSIQERKKPCKNGYLVGKMNKEDEKRKMEELHQQRVNLMIKSTEDSAGLLH